MGNGKRSINNSLLDTVALEMFGDEETGLHESDVRVKRLLLDLVRPDPVQPRRVLPEGLYSAFHSNRLTPSQALRELVQSAQQHGRPFSSVLELLNFDREDGAEQPLLTPDEMLLRELVNLAITIRDDGQVNPLTVMDVSQGVVRQYRIETGERRYWATWLLRDFMRGYEHDGTIPCIIIPATSASAFRQAKENTARSGLPAIALSRQAALLLLSVHGYPIPEGPVTSDFYRQALELDLRSKREFTPLILSSMGGISRQQFSRYKLLLHLSDEALELADRHHLDEGVLRYIISLQPEYHADVVQQIVTHGLTVKQVQALCSGVEQGEDDKVDSTPKHTRQLVRLMTSTQVSSPDTLARLLLEAEKDVHLAWARLQTFQQLLKETELHLT